MLFTVVSPQTYVTQEPCLQQGRAGCLTGVVGEERVRTRVRGVRHDAVDTLPLLRQDRRQPARLRTVRRTIGGSRGPVTGRIGITSNLRIFSERIADDDNSGVLADSCPLPYHGKM